MYGQTLSCDGQGGGVCPMTRACQPCSSPLGLLTFSMAVAPACVPRVGSLEYPHGGRWAKNHPRTAHSAACVMATAPPTYGPRDMAWRCSASAGDRCDRTERAGALR